MRNPKDEKPVRQPEMPEKKNQGITRDERAQDQPADKKRAEENR
jgi:hypothetical protein